MSCGQNESEGLNLITDSLFSSTDCLCIIRQWGWQDLVTQFLVKITFLYKLVAKKLDVVLSKLQISVWKDWATVAW